MKKIAISLFLVFVCFPVNAQTWIRYESPQKVFIDQPKTSKFQEFISQQGVYVLSEIKIAEISSETSDKLDVRIIKATRNNTEKMFAVKFTPVTPDFISKDPYLLDSDEIPGLLVAMDEMLKQYKSYNLAENEIFRYSYISRAGLNFQVRKKKEISFFFFNVDQTAFGESNFNALIESLKKAQSIIQQ